MAPCRASSNFFSSLLAKTLATTTYVLRWRTFGLSLPSNPAVPVPCFPRSQDKQRTPVDNKTKRWIQQEAKSEVNNAMIEENAQVIGFPCGFSWLHPTHFDWELLRWSEMSCQMSYSRGNFVWGNMVLSTLRCHKKPSGWRAECPHLYGWGDLGVFYLALNLSHLKSRSSSWLTFWIFPRQNRFARGSLVLGRLSTSSHRIPAAASSTRLRAMSASSSSVAKHRTKSSFHRLLNNLHLFTGSRCVDRLKNIVKKGIFRSPCDHSTLSDNRGLWIRVSGLFVSGSRSTPSGVGLNRRSFCQQFLRKCCLQAFVRQLHAWSRWDRQEYILQYPQNSHISEIWQKIDERGQNLQSKIDDKVTRLVEAPNSWWPWTLNTKQKLLVCYSPLRWVKILDRSASNG